MAEIRKSTLMTVEQAVIEKEKAIRGGDFKRAMLLGDYINLLSTADIYQTNERMILSNPRSPGKSESYCRVWQLIEDLSFEAVPHEVREQIAALEKGLQNG